MARELQTIRCVWATGYLISHVCIHQYAIKQRTRYVIKMLLFRVRVITSLTRCNHHAFFIVTIQREREGREGERERLEESEEERE